MNLQEIENIEAARMTAGRASGKEPVWLARRWLVHQVKQPRRGFVYVNPTLRAGEFSPIVWSDAPQMAHKFPVGTVEVDVRGLWDAETGFMPQVATRNGWREYVGEPQSLRGQGSEPQESEVRSQILESEVRTRPIRCAILDETDKVRCDQPLVIGEYFGCVVDAVVNLPPWDAQDETFQRCHAEGRAYADDLLRGGSTVAEIRRNSIAPCPHPLGVPQRVWWIQGLLAVLNDAEAEGRRSEVRNQESGSRRKAGGFWWENL